MDLTAATLQALLDHTVAATLPTHQNQLQWLTKTRDQIRWKTGTVAVLDWLDRQQAIKKKTGLQLSSNDDTPENSEHQLLNRFLLTTCRETEDVSPRPQPTAQQFTEFLEALHLQFQDGDWEIVDPAGLTREIAVASENLTIVDKLRKMPSNEALTELSRLRPNRKWTTDAEEPAQIQPGDRYYGIYYRLANQVKDNSSENTGELLIPVDDLDYFTRAENLNELTADQRSLNPQELIYLFAGSRGLPQAAQKDPFWWLGAPGTSRGRPQLRSWWDAGYRVSEVLDGDMAPIRKADGRKIVWVRFISREDANESKAGSLSLKILDTLINSGAKAVSGKDDAVFKSLLDNKRPLVLNNPPFDKPPASSPLKTITDYLHDGGNGRRVAIERALINAGYGADLDPEQFANWVKNLLTTARRRDLITADGATKAATWKLVNDTIEQWALKTIGATPALDSEADGIATFQFSPEYRKLLDAFGRDGAGKVLVFTREVATITPKLVRHLNEILDREEAQLGVLIPMGPFRMKNAGDIKYGTWREGNARRKYPRLQVFSLADLLEGRKPKLPRLDVPFEPPVSNI